MKDYELVVLYHPDLEIDLEKALKKVEKIISGQNGKIVNSENWGKRKLAYPIKKEDHAIYVYYDVELEPTTIGKIESTLNITDEVLRYLITHPVPKFETSDDDEGEDDEKTDDKEEKDEESDSKDEE